MHFFDNQELLPSKIVNPPDRPFKRKTASLFSNPLSNRLKSCSKYLTKATRDEEYAKLAIELTKINPLDRKNDEIVDLIRCTSNLSYFEQINKKELYKEERMHERCCAIMSHEYIEKGSPVFYYGEKSIKFYLILRGSAIVLIPKTADKFISDKEIINDRNIYDFSYLLKLKEKKQIKEDLSPIDPLLNEEDISSGIRHKNEKLQNTLKKFSDLFGGINFFDLKHPETLFEDGILKYTYYRDYKAGDYFGDLGVIRDKPRSATIICKENSDFAVLKADEFRNIFTVVERRKLDEKINFFKNFVMKKISENEMVKLIYAFEKKKFSRNEMLFKEGEKIKEVFLLKNGEIQFFKIVNQTSKHSELQLSKNLRNFGRILPLTQRKIKSKIELINVMRGELFGEEGVLECEDQFNISGIKRSFSATVVSPKATVYVCPIEIFTKFVFERPGIRKKLILKMAAKQNLRDNRLECVNNRVETMPDICIPNSFSVRKSVADLNFKKQPYTYGKKQSFNEIFKQKIGFNQRKDVNNVECFGIPKIVHSKLFVKKDLKGQKGCLSLRRINDFLNKSIEKDNVDESLRAKQLNFSKKYVVMCPDLWTPRSMA